ADNDKGGKAEPATAFHDFGDAVDVHELIDELAVALFASALAGFTRHVGLPFCSNLHLTDTTTDNGLQTTDNLMRSRTHQSLICCLSSSLRISIRLRTRPRRAH